MQNCTGHGYSQYEGYEYMSTNALNAFQFAVGNMTHGGKISVGQGTYNFGASLIVSGNGEADLRQVIIEGEDARYTILNATGSNDLIKFNNAVSLVLMNLKLVTPSTGSGYALYGAKDGASTEISGKRCILDNVHFEGNDNYTMWLKNFFDLRGTSIYINCYGNGVMWDNAATGTTRYGNTGIGDLFINLQAPNKVGLFMNSSSGAKLNLVSIDRLTVYSTSTTGKTAVRMDAVDYVIIQYAMIENVATGFFIGNVSTVGSTNIQVNGGYISANVSVFNVTSQCRAVKFSGTTCVALSTTTTLMNDDVVTQPYTEFVDLVLSGGKWKTNPFEASTKTSITNLHTWGETITASWRLTNSGSQATCVNGTTITHGLIQTPTSITVTMAGNPRVNSTCYYLAPSVYVGGSTTFTICLEIFNAGTITAVAAPNSRTIMWEATYKP
jgi:hypothetical protein